MSIAGRGGRDQADLIADIVIPWRDEGDNGDSLKYALRSLVNLPHGRVLVVGDELPAWADGVEWIGRPRDRSRHEDGQANVLLGLEEVGAFAYLYHDDMYVLRPVDWIGPSHRGFLSLMRGGGEYAKRAQGALGWLRKNGIKHPLNYNAHNPFLVNCERYLEIAKRAQDLPAGFRLSIYGNLLGIPAAHVIDPKLPNGGMKPHPSWPAVSSANMSWKMAGIGTMIRKQFSQPGQYERV